MGATKTDNSFLADKVALRAGHLPDGPVRVLDCFAGEGLVWSGVKGKVARDIDILPIDKKRTGRFQLTGDNRRYLRELDLSRFNAIDLDSYGVPFDQLEILFLRRYKGVVFATFVQTAFGRLPTGLLEAVGFSRAMIDVIPTLYSGRGWQYFLEWLALRGVTGIWNRGQGNFGSPHSRHYVAFRMD